MFACIMLALASAPMLVQPVASMLTSLMAVFCGIMALVLAARTSYRMRYEKTKRSPKVALVIGSLATGCLGLPFAGIILVGATVGTAVISTTERIETPEETAELSKKIFHIDIPSEFKLEPRNARHSAWLMSRFLYHDQEFAFKSNVHFRIDRFPGAFAMNKAQFRTIVADGAHGIVGGAVEVVVKPKQFKWNIEQLEASVFRREIKKRAAPDHNTDQGDQQEENRLLIQYYTLFDIDQYTFGMSLTYDPSECNLAESDIQLMFESFKAVME